MTVATVKGVTAIVPINPCTITLFGASDSLSNAAEVVRPNDAIRINYALGDQVRRNTMSIRQLERLLAWRQSPLSFWTERSEASTDTFNQVYSEKAVIADSVSASRNASNALAPIPLVYAIALQRQLRSLMSEPDFDTEHGSKRSYGNGSPERERRPEGPSP